MKNATALDRVQRKKQRKHLVITEKVRNFVSRNCILYYTYNCADIMNNAWATRLVQTQRRQRIERTFPNVYLLSLNSGKIHNIKRR